MSAAEVRRALQSRAAGGDLVSAAAVALISRLSRRFQTRRLPRRRRRRRAAAAAQTGSERGAEADIQIGAIRAVLAVGTPSEGVDLAALAKQDWTDYYVSMGTGTVASWISNRLTDDAVWAHSGGELPPGAVVGRAAITHHYNRVVEQALGRTVTWDIPSVEQTGPSVVLIHARGNIEREGYTIRKHFKVELVYRGDRICSTRMHIEVVDEEGEGIPPKKSAVSPESPTGSAPASKPPTMEKPCSHNNWDSVRVKRWWRILRCTLCGGLLRRIAFPTAAARSGAARRTTFRG
eukprot:TRINITY_DN20241_c0_g1_i1.p1 TRINITY_DN20241_c0_g1~~TRINITY_DN20241_c0_g1_i1.p1  ORF type:complete len:292 (+),score=44.49 TRINITY_DN20241_c0_g1_i1:56-931(+)